MWRLLSILCVLVVATVGGHAAVFRHGAGTGGGGSCVFTGSVAGSCLPSTDTTDSVNGPRALAPGITDSFKFDNTGLVNYGGGQVFPCPGYFGTVTGGTEFTSCAATTALHVCQTPGNISTASQPWLTEDVGAWQTNPVTYNPHGDGVSFYPGVPSFSPVITFSNNTTFAGLGVGTPHPSLMTSLASCNPSPVDTSSYFVNSRLGPMLNLADALSTMGTGDTVTVSPSPAGIPYWVSGETYLGGGRQGGGTNPAYDVTLIATGALFGYPGTTSKGLFVINENGTTINGGTCFWLNGSQNEECIPWNTGLDLTVKNFRGELGPMGIGRGNIRNGISNFQNVTLESFGCNNSGCNYGNNHNMYLLTADNSGGFDATFIDNQFNPDVTNAGWSIKLRGPPTSTITNSFFAQRINSGMALTHGPVDYPCGGTHSVTYSAMEANPFSLNNLASGQPSSFLVSADEEREGGFCGNRVPFPTYLSAGFSATITGENTFTTTTNPVLFTPLLLSGGTTSFVWDKAVSGRLQNIVGGPNGFGGYPWITGWTGPDGGGNYTVTVTCYANEGTIPFRYGGEDMGACFTPPASGTITLYAMGGWLQQLSNPSSSLTGSFGATVDPRSLGIDVGNTMLTNTGNPIVISSITGSGPYTINYTCAHDINFGTTGPCLTIPEPNALVALDPVASGTYNNSTGAVSLVIGTDLGFTNGSSVTVQGLSATGAGAGNVGSLNGTFTATAGTSGTTLNYTGPSGLGAMTITTNFNGGVGSGLAMPSNINYPIKLLENLVTASTTGSGCDGTNTLCGIAVSPLASFVGQGWQVTSGPNIASGYGCMVAAQLSYIHPVLGSSGTGYAVNDLITLAGGSGSTPAVVGVATIGAGGAVTSVTIATGGVFTSFVTAQSDHKTWTQASTTGGGTGAQFEFAYPTPIVTGTGPYTLRLAQPSGANCITGSSTNQQYAIQRATNITLDHDIFGWDGPCPSGGVCTVLLDWPPFQNAWNRASISNSLLWTNTKAGEGGQIGPTWSASTCSGTNVLCYGPTVTDGGGNVLCNNRKDLVTSPRCAIPPFTAATFTGSVASGTTQDATGATRGTLTVGCVAGSSCMAITSGTYVSSTGVVTLTVPNSNTVPGLGDSGAGQAGFFQPIFATTSMTATGAGAANVSNLNGNWQQSTTNPTGTTLTYRADPGWGNMTITGGNINAAANASACVPGMFLWDTSGHQHIGDQGHIWGGWQIVSGSAPTFTISIPPGGNTTNDLPAGTIIACGWGTPSSAFNGTVNSSGVLTINNGLVGNVHVGDFITDIFAALPNNVRITSGSGTTWQTNYSGSGVAAEYMVSVRSQLP